MKIRRHPESLQAALDVSGDRHSLIDYCLSWPLPRIVIIVGFRVLLTLSSRISYRYSV